jgi:hypothetical protein
MVSESYNIGQQALQARQREESADCANFTNGDSISRHSRNSRTKKLLVGEKWERLFLALDTFANILATVNGAISWMLPRNAKKAHAALWLGVFLMLQAMVVFPGVHALFHSDASDPDHNCAVTLFAHGQAHGADAAVPIVRPEPVALFIQSRPEAGFVSTDVRLLPGRGPPSLPSLCG